MWVSVQERCSLKGAGRAERPKSEAKKTRGQKLHRDHAGQLSNRGGQSDRSRLKVATTLEKSCEDKH